MSSIMKETQQISLNERDPILLPVPSSRHPSNSKVFSSFVTVFMKTKVAPFKISHLPVLPLLGSLGVTCPPQTTKEEDRGQLSPAASQGPASTPGP